MAEIVWVILNVQHTEKAFRTYVQYIEQYMGLNVLGRNKILPILMQLEVENWFRYVEIVVDYLACLSIKNIDTMEVLQMPELSKSFRSVLFSILAQ